MAKTNYAFAKRQKEIAKKAKKAEKQLRKTGNNPNSSQEIASAAVDQKTTS